MNRQARWFGDTHWRDYGAVTHAEAARMHAEFFGRGGEIKTRDQEDGSEGRHTVERKVVYEVRSHRGD